MDLQVFKPTGSEWEGEKVTYGQRLPDLNGKTIAEISNRAWDSDRLFPIIRELLLKRFPDLKIITWDQLPNSSAELVDNEELPDILIAKGVDAAIGGCAG